MATSVKPYSLRTSALVGSATAASVLTCAEPCLCQPANCCGRSGGVWVCAEPGAGFTAKPAPAIQIVTVRAQKNRGKLITGPGCFEKHLSSLDHREQGKVSRGDSRLGCPSWSKTARFDTEPLSPKSARLKALRDVACHLKPAPLSPFTFQVSAVTILPVTFASPSSVPLPTHPSHSPFVDFIAN